jgi:hypothetical protein
VPGGLRGLQNRRSDTLCWKECSIRSLSATLGTSDRDEPEQIVQAKNQALRQPALNLQIAKSYLAGSDNGVNTRTWQHAMEALTKTQHDANKDRWLRVAKDPALTPLLPQIIIETKGEALLRAIEMGTVSTNVFLRRLHNFCADMNWLPWPILPKRQWAVVRFKEKRAITSEEHRRIVERERNPERKAFYQLAWHVGASQSASRISTPKTSIHRTGYHRAALIDSETLPHCDRVSLGYDEIENGPIFDVKSSVR